MEHWDFLGGLCDLSLPEGQLMVEEYLKELYKSAASLSQSISENHDDGENPLLLTTPTSSRTSVARQRVLVGVSGQLFRDNGNEMGGASVVQSLPTADDKGDEGSEIDAAIDSLAELLDKNLSFNEEDTDSHASTNPTPTPPSSNKIFLAG